MRARICVRMCEGRKASDEVEVKSSTVCAKRNLASPIGQGSFTAKNSDASGELFGKLDAENYEKKSTPYESYFGI